MSKGLKVTLLMVAIALVGYRAMAAAPVIGDIKDVIIANDAPVSDGNHYVYPDAINLDNSVTDDSTAAADIVWSYAESTGTYTINGHPEIGAGDPTTATDISATVAGSEENPDSNAATITFRDESVSPLGGTDVGYAAPDGIKNNKVLTLFASDGTTYSSKSILVYSDKVGTSGRVDRLSPGGPTSERITSLGFTTSTNGWIFAQQLGTATSGTTGGICITVPAPGVNLGNWSSPYGIMPLVANSVWRLRVGMTSNNTTAFTNPLWDIVIDNFGSLTTGANAYGADYLFLDNEGGANAPGTLGRGASGFEVWFTPTPVQTAQWNTNAFTGANDPNNDMRIIFRVLDVENAGYGGETDLGQLCLTNLVIDRFNLADLTEESTVYNAATITQATTADPQAFFGSLLIGGTVSFSNPAGTATFTPPASPGWQVAEIGSLTPGDGNNSPGSANSADNYPITWEANTIYKVEVGLSAPDATAATNPPDVIRMGMDAPTQEFLSLGHITPNMSRAGTPVVGAAQTYTMFVHSHSVTLSSLPNGQRLRPRFDLLCADALRANGIAENNGGLRYHFVKVTKIVDPVD